MDAHEVEEIIAIVFLDIALIVTAARLLGVVARRLRQPAVVAEILAALILGPSVLGTLPGNPTEFLFPLEVRPYLAVVAALGLIIFMFVVGLELDLGLIKGSGRAAGIISLSSVALPFTMGAGLAFWLHHRHGTVEGEDVALVPFMLFIGAAMSVTAFPVLARILAERGIHRTPTGSLALACAAVDDVLAWILLAGVLAVVRSSGAADLVQMVVASIVFVTVMFGVVRPRLRVLVSRREAAGRLTPDLFAIVLVGILVCSFITDWIGIHAIFGAFLFGAVMPRAGARQLSQEILERVEQVTVLLLLPVFFVATGLNVDVGALGSRGLLELAAVLVVACAGKFLGAMVSARLVGVPSRKAAAVGVLMNTRGLTELVILNIGLASGVLDRELFTIMVLMAIVTTVITEPLLRLIYPDRAVARDIAAAERQALGLSAEHRVLAAVGGDGALGAAHAVDVGVALLGREPSSQLLISRFETPHGTLEVGSGLTSELAAVAASFERTQDLSRRAGMHEADVVVHSQFSDNPPRDLALQVKAVAADVVVLAGDEHLSSELARPLVGTSDAVVVQVLSDVGPDSLDDLPDLLERVRAVLVVPGTGADGLAAVEQGIRVADRLGVPLSLASGEDRRERRRCAALQRRLSSAGVRVQPESLSFPGSPDPLALLLIGYADGRGNPHPDQAPARGYCAVLRVHAAVGEHGERLDMQLARRSDTARA